MKNKLIRILILISLSLNGGGCTSNKLDFCTLLSLDELAEFNADIVSSQMGVRDEEAPTRYCIYKTGNGDEVFLLSIGNPTKNLPYDILQTFSLFMDGENSVDMVMDVGNTAAALFSNEFETSKFRILIANSSDWSVTIRAKGVSSKYSEKFSTLKTLANKALERF
jgi:hypothetical protein